LRLSGSRLLFASWVGLCAGCDSSHLAVVPSDCLISQVGYPQGFVNPANPCQSCQKDVATMSWSDTPGICCIGGVPFNQGDSNPTSACDVCHPDLDPGAWSRLPDGARCGDGGEVCVLHQCRPGCLIDGRYWVPDSGVVVDGYRPSCDACYPDVSVNSWTKMSIGSQCGDGPSFCSPLHPVDDGGPLACFCRGVDSVCDGISFTGCCNGSCEERVVGDSSGFFCCLDRSEDCALFAARQCCSGVCCPKPGAPDGSYGYCGLANGGC